MFLFSFTKPGKGVGGQVLDELNGFGIQFLSQRDAIDTEGPVGRAIIVIVSAIAELEHNITTDRVRAGMRRAKLEGRQIGRARLDVNREQVVEDRRGMSLTQVAKKHGISWRNRRPSPIAALTRRHTEARTSYV
jgi:DNA invertase Pin-like site-specific DNA recombinase